jgi:putative ABC transport system ATP-binding protein
MILQAKKLYKTYHEGSITVAAVKDVSVFIEKGEMIAIMGPSGSGKTTLISMLGCILKPTSGNIFINGLDITSLSEKKLPEIRSRYIGFVFQAFNLFPSLTAIQNVEIALNLKNIKGKKAKDKAFYLLEKVGLKDRIGFLPRDLSGGQKQRVSIARAIAGNPALILADEPTGNLDSKSGHEVICIMRELSRENKSAVIIVTHDSRISDVVDRVLYLEDGILRSTDPIVGREI